MRITCITAKLNFVSGGGSSDENDLLFRSLQEIGHEVRVVTVFSGFNRILEPLPYELHEEDKKCTGQLAIQREIYRLLKKYEQGADAFHVDGHIFLYGAGAYRRAGGKPVAAFFNREQISWGENASELLPQKKRGIRSRVRAAIRYAVERFLFIPLANGIDIFMFTNPYLEQSYRRFGLRTEGRSIIIGEMFDWKKFREERSISPDSYERKLPTGRVNILYVGRMVPGKGFDLLLAAFEKVRNKSDFNLVFVGSGPEENALREMCSRLGLDPFVRFAGYLKKTELYSIFHDTDLFIQPKWRKDMSSMSLLTAMIFGIPSIVPEGGGLQWMAGESARLFRDNDASDLARAIEEIGKNSDERIRRSREANLRLSDPVFDRRDRARKVSDALAKLIA